jgi:hypothetical protein
MADPRRISTRRAVLSYSQIRDMNPNWTDLMVKDYQGILQDFAFTSDEVDGLEVIVIENSSDIVELQDSHYPSLSAQMQQIQKQLNGLPEFTIDTTGFTADSSFITTDKVIA